MKRIICFLLACVMIGSGSYACFATLLRGDDEVDLHKKGGGEGNGPKAPATVPIVCLLNTSSQTISSSAPAALGLVTITVENQSSGVVYQDCFSVSHLMYLSETGSYTVSYVTVSGDVYEGSFIL